MLNIIKTVNITRISRQFRAEATTHAQSYNAQITCANDAYKAIGIGRYQLVTKIRERVETSGLFLPENYVK